MLDEYKILTFHKDHEFSSSRLPLEYQLDFIVIPKLSFFFCLFTNLEITYEHVYIPRPLHTHTYSM